MKKIIHHIKNVRQQPEEAKRQILHLATLIFAIILFSLWVYSLGAKFSDIEREYEASSDTGPLSALKENLVGGYKSIREEE